MNEVATKYTIPANLLSFFVAPPILINESRRDYNQVLTGTIEAIEPKATFEWFLVKDLVDLTWEIRRSGKNKAALMNTIWKEALRVILESLLDGDSEERRRVAQERTDAYFTEEGRNWVVAFLLGHNLTEDAIAAQAMALRLPELDIIDRKMERARVSRMAIMRDIEHHRVVGSWKVPKDLLQIVDAAAEPIPLAPPIDHAAQTQ
jgi:hypothetical protein